MRPPNRLLAALLCLLPIVAGCATAVGVARKAEFRQDYDRAVVEYSRALKDNPNNVDARSGLQRAKARAALAHFAQGRRLAAAGKLTEALSEYQIASEMNPDAAEIQLALRTTQTQLRTQVQVDRNGKTELESLVERTRSIAPPGRTLPTGDTLPDFVFRNASNQDIIVALARIANVNVVFDPAFRPTSLSYDTHGQTFEQALRSISAATQTFYRVTAPGTVTIIPDTPAKRREYEEEAVKTFYLSNADPKEAMDLLRTVIDARQIGLTTANNAITVRDTPERIAAAGRLIDTIDKARPEVIIDTELLEVSRTRLNEFGLQLASAGAAGISGSASISTTPLTLANIQNLSQSDILLSSVPTLYYRLLKSDENTRVLANPHIRATAGIAATARFGERVPVPVTVFSPIATGGINQQPITSYDYQNIGVNIDITPRVHMDDGVTLALKISVTSISGTGFGGLPTFGNREISTQLRLKDGETNLLAGLIRDDDRRLMEGIPGLSDLPLVGRMFAHNRNEHQQTDVILMLTPHIVRVLDLSEEDLRPFIMDRDLNAPGGPGLAPAPQPQPQGPQQGQPPQQPQPQQPPSAQPILPPAPTPSGPTPPTVR